MYYCAHITQITGGKTVKHFLKHSESFLNICFYVFTHSNVFFSVIFELISYNNWDPQLISTQEGFYFNLFQNTGQSLRAFYSFYMGTNELGCKTQCNIIIIYMKKNFINNIYLLRSILDNNSQ